MVRQTPSSITGSSGAPAWVQTVRRKYLSGDASVFVLYRNIYDLIPLDGKLVELEEYLFHTLLEGKKKRVLSYNPASGITARTGKFEISDEQPLDRLEEALLSGEGTGVIIHYAGSIFPAGDAIVMSPADRQAVIKLHRWSLNPVISASDSVVFLLVESLAELNPQILSNPRIAAIEVPMPGPAEREAVIRIADPSLADRQVKHLSHNASGLRLIQILGLLKPAEQLPGDDEREKLIRELLQGSEDIDNRARKLAGLTRGQSADEIRHLLTPGSKAADDDDVYDEIVSLMRTRKRELVTQECYGLIEFVDSKVNLDAVGGMEAVKGELLAIAKAIRDGDPARAPMGLLIVGPMGSGKTFITKAFVTSAGLPAVVLKNFRSKWVGSTEGNLEKVLAMVKAMGPIAVIIDEGDRSLGGSGDEDGGTTSRVLARLKEFMSDTDNRGQVLFVLMTNRPDKLDADMKRPGRFDAKIPLFYPQNGKERADIVRSIVHRYGRQFAGNDPSGAWLDAVFESADGYSNAELEAVALLALEFAERSHGELSEEIIRQSLTDFMPTRDQAMVDYMELLAVSEASRRSLLPDKFRNRSTEDLGNALRAMRRQLGL
jgi:SpoVK/Ycf46/Vps4 family AAA+-type ATPase